MISSDWNQCLAPCGPFDPIAYNYPQLQPELEGIFKLYTGNHIRLGDAATRIASLLPEPLTQAQMDAYLDAVFRTYPGVSELIAWCAANRVLFMINTTGMIGYFQRVWAKRLLPGIPVLSAHPLVRFPSTEMAYRRLYTLAEIEDKGRHSAAAAQAFQIPTEKILVVGDSGG